MKKVLLTAALLGSMFAANAQSGKFYLGGGLSYTSNPQTSASNGTKSVDNTTSFFGIQPEVGYFLKDNMVLGLGLGYTSTSFTDNIANANPKTTSKSMIMLNPYFRYFFPATEKLSFFAQINFVYGTGTNSATVSSGPTPADDKVSKIGFSVAPGIAWAATNKLTFVSTLGRGLFYDGTTYDNGTVKRTDNTTGFELFNGIGFGLYYTLN